jgi:hypothetical protein
MSAMEDQVEKLTPVSAIRREGRGPVVGVIDGASRVAEPSPEPLNDTTPSDVDQENDQQSMPKPMARLRSSGAIPLLAGGISGAIAAIIALFLINTFQPPLDPRVVPMAGQLSGFVQQMYNLETSLRAVEVDLVRVLGTNSVTGDRLAAQDAKIADGLSRMTAAQENLRVQNGPGSPVFGVAVVQLMNAVRAGRPFESEWVNVFALTADTPELRESLMPMVSVVREGVPTPLTLSAKLRARAIELGAPVDQPGDVLQASLAFLQERLGIPIGLSAADEVVQSVLARTDRFLQAGKLDDALAMFSNLGDATTGDFEEWLALAQTSAMARRVVDQLSVVSRSRLRDRARNSTTLNTADATESN